MNKKPLGHSVSTSLNRNCLLCTRNFRCRDPDKGISYACSRFKSVLELDASEGNFQQHYEQTLEEPTGHTPSGLSSINRSVFNTKQQITEEDDEDSILGIINKVLESGSPVPPDLRINDQDIIKPANILDWMTGDDFIAGGEGNDVEKPFAKQLEVALAYLGEWCPRCSDEDYFEDVPVDDSIDDFQANVVPLRFGKCPNCGWNKSQLVTEGLLDEYYGAVGLVGQRAGKTITSTMIESYNIARWLTTPSIPQTYNIRSSSIITASYTAVTFKQAQANFWEPLNAILSTAPWFRIYHAFLAQVGAHHGEELVKHGETLLAYRHRNMFCSPATPSQRSLRGRTRFSGVIDEAGWFRTGVTKGGKEYEQMNGLEVYKALQRSMTTLRVAHTRRIRGGYYNVPKPLFTLISSPQARNDLIMTKYRDAENSTQIYRFRHATWDFNPQLTREDFNEEFRTDPVGSARDYECEPPLAMNPWITDQTLVESTFGQRVNAVQTINKRVRTKSQKLNMAAHYKTVKAPWYTDTGAILGIDAGSVNNSFSFCVAIPTKIPDSEDSEEEDVLTSVEIVAVGEVIPRDGVPVSFSRVYRDLLMPICEEYHVGAVISDRWQNRKIVQDLEESLGIPYYEYKLTMQDFEQYRNALYDAAVLHPRLDMDPEDILNITLEEYPMCFRKTPVAHLFYQMLTVQNAGNAVVKGDGVTDDIFRATAIAFAGLQDEDILEDVLAIRGFSVASPALGAVARGSAGGTNNGARAGSVMAVAVSRSGSGAAASARGGVGTVVRGR